VAAGVKLWTNDHLRRALPYDEQQVVLKQQAQEEAVLAKRRENSLGIMMAVTKAKNAAIKLRRRSSAASNAAAAKSAAVSAKENASMQRCASAIMTQSVDHTAVVPNCPSEMPKACYPEFQSLYALGFTAYFKGQWDEARQHLLACAAIDPDDVPTQVLLDVMEKRGGKWDDKHWVTELGADGSGRALTAK
jgi:leucyl aminopeptidase (aminopeptidase T)